MLLILLGLPLLSVWVARRPAWGRLRPGRDRDEFADASARYGISSAQVARVEHALAAGTALSDPAERAAAADWAHRQLAAMRLPADLRRRPGLLLLLVGCAAFYVAFAVHVVRSVLDDDLGPLFSWTMIYLVGGLGWGWRRRRVLRRAVRLNTDPPGTVQRE